MKLSKNIRQLFSLILWLIALHSLAVGLILIFSPGDYLEFWGYPAESEPFFRMQGGVFHIIMSIIYMLAAIHPAKNKPLVIIIIVAKFCAAIFLFTYFILISRIWIVLISGFIDLLMGILVWRFQMVFSRSMEACEEEISDDKITADNTTSGEQ